LFEDLFTQTNALRRHFYQLVVGDPLDSFLESHLTMRGDQDVLVAGEEKGDKSN